MSIIKFQKFLHGFDICDSVYDSLNTLKWSGGRFVPLQPKISIEEYIKIVKEFNELGIKYFFVFTNYNIDEESLKDEECNQLLEAFKDSDNGVIVSSKRLARYIREKYPNYTITCSATLDLKEPDIINKIVGEGLFDMVVVSSDISDRFHILEQLKNKDKIEIITDEGCIKDCPHRIQHYSDINERIQEYREKGFSNKVISCISRRENKLDLSVINELDSDEIQKLLEMGFNNFKLTHREVASNLPNFIEKHLGNIIDAYYKYNSTK